MNLEERAQSLAEAGLLTERQAEAFILRKIELVPRQAAADQMGISVNVLDTHLGAARSKTKSARATVEEIDRQRHEDIPTECSECESTLGGVFSTTEDGDALCLECAGIDADEALS